MHVITQSLSTNPSGDFDDSERRNIASNKARNGSLVVPGGLDIDGPPTKKYLDDHPVGDIDSTTLAAIDYLAGVGDSFEDLNELSNDVVIQELVVATLADGHVAADCVDLDLGAETNPKGPRTNQEMSSRETKSQDGSPLVDPRACPPQSPAQDITKAEETGATRHNVVRLTNKDAKIEKNIPVETHHNVFLLGNDNPLHTKLFDPNELTFLQHDVSAEIESFHESINRTSLDFKCPVCGEQHACDAMEKWMAHLDRHIDLRTD